MPMGHHTPHAPHKGIAMPLHMQAVNPFDQYLGPRPRTLVDPDPPTPHLVWCTVLLCLNFGNLQSFAVVPASLDHLRRVTVPL